MRGVVIVVVLLRKVIINICECDVKRFSFWKHFCLMYMMIINVTIVLCAQMLHDVILITLLYIFV